MGTKVEEGVRKEQIMNACLKLARKHNYTSVTRPMIADACGCSEGTVARIIGTMTQLDRNIMRHAIAKEDLIVLAQGLATKNKHALKASDELKIAAAEALKPKSAE